MAVHLSHSLHLRADGLSVSYGHRRVFTDLGFTVSPGQRLGLIGENGVGKSTLLRLLAGADADADGRADAASAALGDAIVSGRLSRPARTGLLAQELPFRPDDRFGDVLEAALAEVRAIDRELHRGRGIRRTVLVGARRGRTRRRLVGRLAARRSARRARRRRARARPPDRRGLGRTARPGR